MSRLQTRSLGFLSLLGLVAIGVGADLVACAAPSTMPSSFRAHEWKEGAVEFGGVLWSARSSEQPTGAGHNRWAAEGAFIDKNGHLRLRIAPRGGVWRAAEVSRPLPDGGSLICLTFHLPLSPDANVVFGAFVYQHDESEFDLELSTWRDRYAANAQYVVSSSVAPLHVRRFDLDASKPVRHCFRWRPGELVFQTEGGEGARRHVVRGALVPTPHAHRLHLNLWLIKSDEVPRRMQEVVVSEVSVVPLRRSF